MMRPNDKGAMGGRVMRTVLAKTAAVLGLVLLAPALAAAQSWPQKPIKMIVPFPAGGGTDFIGRVAAKHLSTRLGQQVVVENRGGANGAIGLQALMQSDPDGYTIATSSDTPLVVNPVALRQAALPGAARFRAGGDLGAIPRHAGGASLGAGADRGRADRARQGEARRARLCVGRRRQFQPSGDGAVLAGDRREAAARAVQGHRPRLAGAARGRRADGVQQRADAAAERPRRPAAGARGRRAAAGAGAARRADGGRDRARLHHGAVDRHHRPGQDAEGDRGAALAGDAGGDARSAR